MRIVQCCQPALGFLFKGEREKSIQSEQRWQTFHRGGKMPWVQGCANVFQILAFYDNCSVFFYRNMLLLNAPKHLWIVNIVKWLDYGEEK